MSIEITRSGTWPIMKYTFRGPHGHYAVVILDDKGGDIFINPGNQIAFLHWWGLSGRVTPKLREFLVKTSVGYLEDKFSYGLSRWSHDEALKDLHQKFEAEWGHPDSWPSGVVECYEVLNGCGTVSSDFFYSTLHDCDEVMEKFGHDDLPSGEMHGNVEVTEFLKSKWPHFVAYWKKELEEELGELRV